MLRRFSTLIAAALLMTAAAALPTNAAFHTVESRDRVLAQVSTIVDQAEQSGALGSDQARQVREEIAALNTKVDGLTLADLERVEHIQTIFASAHLESVMLKKAQVYVAQVMDDMKHLYTHVVNDHGGKFE